VFRASGPADVRFFYDCEFIEDGRTIDLVSIGVVREDGSEYYAVSTEFDSSRANPWVRRHVLDQLPSPADSAWRDRASIRDSLMDFFVAGGPGRVELWAWISAYDHVCLAQLWGDMRALPAIVPRFTHDLRQRWEDAGAPPMPPPPRDRHDALADARHNLARWQVIEQVRAGGGPLQPAASSAARHSAPDGELTADPGH
jgi:3' exoribonuclease, RNase T-like